MILKDKRIFITGGAGFLGKALIKELIQDNEITIYSRDEAKHYYLKKQYPKINCVVGDIRNLDLMNRAAKRYACNVGIFAASMKQIEACDENAEEAIHIIALGAVNSRKVAEDNGFLTSTFVSTDKATSPNLIYGALKLAGEKAFIYNSMPHCKLSACRWGNIISSTGSIFPLMHQAIKENFPLTLYSEEMTRFFITVNEAIKLIEVSLDHSGKVIAPALPSFLIKDAFELFSEKFGLKYSIGKPRPSEKLHELMVSAEESSRVSKYNGTVSYYTIDQVTVDSNVKFSNNELSSKDVVVSKQEFKDFLDSKNWLIP